MPGLEQHNYGPTILSKVWSAITRGRLALPSAWATCVSFDWPRTGCLPMMRLHVSSFKGPISSPCWTLMRWKSTQAATSAGRLSTRLTTLGLRGPSVMKLEKVPLDVTRVEIIKELMAAGPIGRVLTLSITAPDTTIRPTMRRNRTRVTIEYDTKGEVERLAYFIGTGAFTVRGNKPLYFQTYGEPGVPPWLALDADPGNPPVHLLPGSQLPSRVLRILGPASSPVMTEASLRGIFEQQKIDVETECIGIQDYNDRATSMKLRIIEWRFCDWTNQARHAYLALKHVADIYVTYGLDPCERGFSLHELDRPLPSIRSSQRPGTQATSPADQGQHQGQLQHGAEEKSRNEQLEDSALQALEAASLAERRRRGITHPEFDSWARAWINEHGDESQDARDQKDRQSPQDTPQQAQSSSSHPIAQSTPTPSTPDSPPCSSTQVP